MERFEIDQSGKIEQLDTYTVVAGANEETRAVWLSAGVKRKLIQRLRKSCIPQKDLLPILFAVLCFLLLKTLPQLPNVIVIDEEYTVKESMIKEILLKLLNRQTRGKWQGGIGFKMIGHGSPAHRLAWSLHRLKKSNKTRVISENEVLSLLKLT